jgi:hypothetical protein
MLPEKECLKLKRLEVIATETRIAYEKKRNFNY